MTTKELIRAEIERRMTDNTFGAKLELMDILSFLDTLEEPSCPKESDDLKKEVQHYYSDNFDYITSDQPTLSILTNIARHFAQWGAEHLRDSTKKVSEDLESEIEKAGEDVLRQAHKHNKIFDIPQTHFEDVQLMDIFKSGVYKGYELGRETGAEWQKKHMTVTIKQSDLVGISKLKRDEHLY